MRIGNVTTKSNEKIFDKLRSGQEVFLKNTLNAVAIRIEPDNVHYFIKSIGLDEYSISRAHDLVCDTILEANEISKEEYSHY